TSVIATAGRIPTTTVAASSTRAIPAMFASMRPMNESTTSSAEMSIRTPCARVAVIRSVRSSCSDIASWSCMSTWMETSRQSPILRIGMRSTSCSGGGGDRETAAVEGDRERIRERGLRDHALEVDPEMHDRLRDLRADTADDALRAHEPRGGDGLQQML